MRGHRHCLTSSVLGLMALLVITTAAWTAQVRMATYNIQFLSAEVINQGDRLSKLREVIALLDAHVIGLQESADRAALERVFHPTEWHLVIDGGSTDAQDLAVAVRKPSIKASQTLNSLPTFHSIDFGCGSLRYFCVDGRLETSRLLTTPRQYGNRPAVLAQPGIVYDPDTSPMRPRVALTARTDGPSLAYVD